MALPEPITRRELLDPEGVYCDRMRTRLRARLALVAELGCTGKIPPERVPGYAVGVKAAAELLKRFDPVRPDGQYGGPPVVNVAIISTEAAGYQAPHNGVAIRFLGGNGDRP